MSVVSISRQFGSGGRTLSESVARRLGYQYVDDELVSKAAEVVNMPKEDVEAMCHPPVSGEVFISALVHTPMIEHSLGLGPSGIEEGKIVRLFAKLIPELAARDNVVFIGRGSQFLLPDGPHTVKILLVAKQEDREKFMMSKYSLSGAEAYKAVHRGEKQRVDFLRRFVSDPNDPCHYDLAINVSLINLKKAEDMICDLVMEKAKTP